MSFESWPMTYNSVAPPLLTTRTSSRAGGSWNSRVALNPAFRNDLAMSTDRTMVEKPWSETTKTSVLSRSEEHTSELQSQSNLVCRLLLEKKKASLGHALPLCGPLATFPRLGYCCVFFSEHAWTTCFYHFPGIPPSSPLSRWICKRQISRM